MSEEELQMARPLGVEVLVLSPGPSPRNLTANAPNRSLHDHLLAFLASNNLAGHIDDQALAHLPEDSIGGQLLLALERDSMSLRMFKDRAGKLKKASAGNLRHCQCLDLLSRLFGYKDWHHTLASAKSEWVINRRTNRGSMNMQLFGVAAHA